MKNLDKETQIIAVEKVLEEMQKAEEYVKWWNANWYERLLDAHCIPLHHEICEADVRDMERKYESRYKLANAFYSGENIGIPLAKETLVGDNTLTSERNINFECEFGKIEWYGMTSHKAERFFSFDNNGEIYFSKEARSNQTPQHPKHTSYNATFNVLSNDFNVNITLDELIQEEWRNKYKYDYFTISLCGNILTKKFNDIEIAEDLNTGMKLVRIVKKYNKRNRQNNPSIVFEATLNSDDSLEMGTVTINTHKGNGKVNGTYRFDVSREKGIRANFYSRKGVKVDLTTNPMLLETVNNLLLATLNNQNSGDITILNFANSIQNTIARNPSQRVISFDPSDFNMETAKQTESMVGSRTIGILKNIKGELPLSGLVERIDNCLDLIDKQHNSEIDGTPKTLKLESKN